MGEVNRKIFQQLYKSRVDSHKGENGKVLVIAGSDLFHGAALWPCEIASRIVDLVFFSSTPFNNKIFEESKEVFRNGIVVPRGKLDDYINEADSILIGPGMMRADAKLKAKSEKLKIEEIVTLEDEGEQTYYLTKYLLEKYPEKKFVIDGGALQMLEPVWLDNLKTTPILTPHKGEFSRLIGEESRITNHELRKKEISKFAKLHSCVMLLKGREDVVCDNEHCMTVPGGNEGMAKGGTGDVLAGIAVSLYAKNPAFLSTAAASYINKRAGEMLSQMVGPFFNASDLAREVPVVMNELMY